MAELAPQELIASLRRPTIIATDSYLNDPIKFNTDNRFLRDSVVKQINELVVLPRDYADFAVVELNTMDKQYYATAMFSEVYNRDDFQKIIKTTIKQLPTSDLPL